MRREIRLPILGLALACGASLAAQTEPADNPGLPGVDYALLVLGPLPQVPERSSQYGPFWERRGKLAGQIEAANAANGGDQTPPLAVGWIDADTYVRITPGVVTYFNPLPGPTSGRDATQMCRISVNIERSGVVGPDVLHAINVAQCAAPPASIVAGQAERHRRGNPGTMTAQTVLTAPDGEAMFVQHRGGGFGSADDAVAVDAAQDVGRAYYQLPTRNSLAFGAVQRAWVIERSDGTFDLVVRFKLLDNGSHGGCVVRNARGSFPSESWITPDLTRWCGEQDERHKANLPPEQRRGG